MVAPTTRGVSRPRHAQGDGRSCSTSCTATAPDRYRPTTSFIRAAPGTHDGPLRTPTGEIPSTGRSIELEVVEVIGIRAGKIAAISNYWDSATLMRQLGVDEQGG